MSARSDEARATLMRLGVDPDALPADAGAEARLRPLVAGPEGAALVAALAEFPSAAALLVALEPHATDRAARKAIRGSLYRLRQRGVAVPDPPPTPVPAAWPPGAEPEGFVTAFGGDGDRILWLVKPLREGGSLLVYAHVHDQRGLVELTSGELSRKKLREVRHQLETGGAIRLVPADWRVVDALLVEAHERAHAEEKRRNYLKVRHRITAEPPAPAAEPVSRRVTVPAADELPGLVAGSAALLAEPELASWVPSLEQLAPFVEELGTAHESPLVLSRGAQEERVRAVVRRAVAALAPAAVFVRRLEGTAYVLAETGRVPQARQALGVAAALRARPEDLVDVPLALAYVERPLGEILAATTARREEEQKSSLVVTPGQFLRDRSSSRPTRTRG